MATEKQIEANRRNAQQSTGPRTAEGKAAARRNALSSGIYAEREVILPCENPQDLETLTAEYHQRYQPITPETRCLVDSLVSDEWLLRRFRTIEAQLMDRAIRSTSYPEQHTPLGQAYARAENQLERLQRRINATRRSYQQALATLTRLQALEMSQVESDPPEPDPPNESVTSVIGFVPSTVENSPEAHPPAARFPGIRVGNPSRSPHFGKAAAPQARPVLKF